MNAIFKCGACGKEFVAEHEINIEEMRKKCVDHENECYQITSQHIKKEHNVSLAKCCMFCVHAKATIEKTKLKCEKLQNVILDGGAEIGILMNIYECCPLFELKDQTEEVEK